jgi:hypothetical protein
LPAVSTPRSTLTFGKTNAEPTLTKQKRTCSRKLHPKTIEARKPNHPPYNSRPGRDENGGQCQVKLTDTDHPDKRIPAKKSARQQRLQIHSDHKPSLRDHHHHQLISGRITGKYKNINCVKDRKQLDTTLSWEKVPTVAADLIQTDVSRCTRRARAGEKKVKMKGRVILSVACFLLAIATLLRIPLQNSDKNIYLLSMAENSELLNTPAYQQSRLQILADGCKLDNPLSEIAEVILINVSRGISR